MKAELLLDERHVLDARTFVEIVVWHLPRPARASKHRFKYRLALVIDGICVLRYDTKRARAITATSAVERKLMTSPIRARYLRISGATSKNGDE
jgi:hypothetical protein